jgi:hypothetical protein
MGNIFLSFLVLTIFVISGNGIYKLSTRATRNGLIQLIQSAWLGLLALTLSGIILYHIFLIPVGHFAKPLLLFFCSSSLIFFFWKKPYFKINAASLFIILISLLTILLMSSPFLEKTDLTYFFSNNGEYINYALMTDLVQFHSPTEPIQFIGVPPAQSRESIIGMLCALFTTIFNKSALLIVEPVSYALSWLSFLTFGALLYLALIKKFNLWWTRCIFAFTLIAALFSAANLQLWTLSFMSQYLNQTLLAGCILFFILNSNVSMNNILFGFVLLVSACVYPEMFIPSAFMLSVIYILFTKNLSVKLFWQKNALIFIFLALTCFICFYFFPFVFERLAPFFHKGNHILSGWDIYGPRDNYRALIGNFFGLSNVFWGSHSPTLISLIAVILLLIIGFWKTCRQSVNKVSFYAKALSLLFIIYSAASLFLLRWVARHHYPNNYVAVKFIISWIAIIYIGLALLFAIEKSKHLKALITVLGIIIISNVLVTSYQYSHCLREDSKEEIFSENSINDIRKLIINNPPIIRSVPKMNGIPINSLVGNFIIYDRNLSPQNITIPPKNDLTNLFILVLGPGYSKWTLPSYQSVYTSNAMGLFKKNS